MIIIHALELKTARASAIWFNADDAVHKGELATAATVKESLTVQPEGDVAAVGQEIERLKSQHYTNELTILFESRRHTFNQILTSGITLVNSFPATRGDYGLIFYGPM